MSRAEILSYAAQHRLQELLEGMTAHVLHTRPEDPVAALVTFLQELQAGGDATLLGDADFQAVFDQLDVGGTGFITLEQAAQGIEKLDRSGCTAGDLEQRFPGGEVSKNGFVMYLRERSQQRWASEPTLAVDEE